MSPYIITNVLIQEGTNIYEPNAVILIFFFESLKITTTLSKNDCVLPTYGNTQCQILCFVDHASFEWHSNISKIIIPHI